MRKSIFLVFLALFAVFFLSGCGVFIGIKNILGFGEKEDLYYGVTAKQWYNLIEEKAKAWRPDAYLYGISEAEVRSDGSSDKWQYLFYSPGSEKTVMFIFESGFISIREAVLQPLGRVENFNIDSPTALNKAFEVTKKFREKNPNVTIIMSLIGPSLDRSRTGTRWLVKFYGSVGSTNVLIDASTGKVLQIF